MKSRGLIVAALILAALSGALYWSNHRKPSEAAAKPDPDAPPKILSFSEGDITTVVIRKKGQPAVVLAKQGGAWKLTAPKALDTDAASVTGVVSTLSSLSSDRLVDDKTTDLKQYGLADPALEVEFTAKGRTEKLLVGDLTINGSANYAAVAGDPHVYTIATYVKSSLDKNVGDLRDTRLLTVDFDKATQIELTTETPGKKQTMTFLRDNESWQMVKPKPIRVDPFQVDGIVRSLRDLKIETSPDGEKKSTAAFASGTPFALAKVTSSLGTEQLQVRKNKDDYYAKSSAVEGVFKISSGIATGLDKSLDDLRNKKIFDFGFGDPDRIEIHEGAQATYLTHGGSDWFGADGKKLDARTVEPVVEKLRDLAAVKFPDSEFRSPSIEITVVSKSGKRTEKVSIAKAGANYTAKREGEAELYEVGAVPLGDLQQAVAGVKLAPPPAAPAPKKK
jgi:uncharacterized protein DUF4340